MKFLLDMGLAQSTAKFLRQHDHDAIHLRDEGLQRLADEQIITKALAENRVILTHDLDFGRLMALSQARYPSVITFRLKDMRHTQVNFYLTEVLNHFTEALESGVLISVNEEGIRVRQLPVSK
jgi:predicted nuclease of predicted toxin-antitoxin system